MQTQIANPSIPPANKLRLVILYALRYQKTAPGNITALISSLLEQGVSREDAQVWLLFVNLTVILTYNQARICHFEPGRFRSATG